MDSWKQEARRLRVEENMSWTELSRRFAHLYPGKTLAQFRKAVNDSVRSPGHKPIGRRNLKEPVCPDDTYKTSNSWKNGTMESDCIIEIHEGETITPELILKLHNLDVSQWDVISYVNNRWHNQKKGGDRIVMYQSKLYAKPITNRVTFADVEKYFETKEFTPCPDHIYTSKWANGTDTLIIDVADLHSGLLAWGKEAGEDYDVKIMRERFMSVINDIIDRCRTRKFKKIIFAFLGDLLHVDNDFQTTTKGTFQQADGRMAKIFSTTLDMLIDACLALNKIAPIDVIYTSGNHDGTSGWMLIKALAMTFRTSKGITVDVSPDPQKTRLIGNSLIGFVHGDMPTKNLSGWIQVAARKLDSSVKFLEVHCGHLHMTSVKERIQTSDNEGVITRIIPTICSSSTWEHREGYAGTVCAAMSYVWSEENGLREIWQHNV